LFESSNKKGYHTRDNVWGPAQAGVPFNNKGKKPKSSSAGQKKHSTTRRTSNTKKETILRAELSAEILTPEGDRVLRI